ncbi:MULTISPECIES: TonB-dependent receptor [Methylomonas]|uniref:Iron complex outermembrane receptor protein n=1 Tax=Methylomonas methanica TaxID=421 RepID=A0ABY2CQA1_METMH|nr:MULTISPECIES: TonB-dependent receptor [Methylomonas]TCV86257.1 iron complex outermembrane receptor protein [Methylomonas methanica]
MKENLIGSLSADNIESVKVPLHISNRRGLSVCVAMAIAGGSMLIATDATAQTASVKKSTKKTGNKPVADTTVSDLQAQVDRLSRELEASKRREQDLLKKGVATAPAAAGAADATALTSQEPDNVVAAAEPEPEEKADEPQNLSEVVVTSRRKEEKLQEVPIPVAVINRETLERDNVVSVQDFSRRAPNLGVTSANARQTSIALRGLGKNSGNESMESSVGVMVDNVWRAWVGSAWANFADLDQVEVLRGPQGTLQGKNSNLGLLNITTKAPSFKNSYYVDGFAGDRDTLQGKFGATGTILPGLLAYRASGFIDKRDGYIKNYDIHRSEGDLGETNALGGRLQFLLTPSEVLSAKVIVDKTASTQTMSVQPLIADPSTFANGTSRGTTFSTRLARNWFDPVRSNGQPLAIIGDPRAMANNERRQSRGDGSGVSAEINYDALGHRFTSISAWRDALFEPNHDGESSTADIERISGWTVKNEQWSQELRISSKEKGPIDYQAGVFAMRTIADTFNQRLFGGDAGAFYASDAQYSTLNSNAIGRQMMGASLNNVMYRQSVVPATDSYAAYGQINWHVTDDATVTVGLRDTFERRESTGWSHPIGGVNLDTLGAQIGASAGQIAAAKAVRSGRLGSEWDAPRQGFDQNSQNWLLNPSYKVNKDLMVYGSVAGGNKSGAAQFNLNTGKVENVNPENVMDYEFGIKSTWLDRKLVANVNFYQTDIEGFQSQLVIPCTIGVDGCTTGNRTTLGNIKGIQLRGIELETNYDITPGLSVFLNGSFNRAIYTDFANAPCPPEANNNGTCDQTGMTLPNAPTFTANYGVDYRAPLTFGYGNDYGLQWHAYLIDSYKSTANYNSNLSTYGKQPAYHVTDGGIGVGTKNGKYNLDLVGRNIFDTIYFTNVGNYTNNSAVSAAFGDARYYGVHFRAKF